MLVYLLAEWHICCNFVDFFLKLGGANRAESVSHELILHFLFRLWVIPFNRLFYFFYYFFKNKVPCFAADCSRTTMTCCQAEWWKKVRGGRVASSSPLVVKSTLVLLHTYILCKMVGDVRGALNSLLLAAEACQSTMNNGKPTDRGVIRVMNPMRTWSCSWRQRFVFNLSQVQ